ncbi:hypothetical protein EXN66_Car010102 [Channa argus]|uniref:Uncharacterized protein n=1 Tax=Channa argus TaxID=215402 RepID=A0A6G1PWS9_CHAAH|nr:hypothetical protein EXN66_Car010102 [Channa argus]
MAPCGAVTENILHILSVGVTGWSPPDIAANRRNAPPANGKRLVTRLTGK